MPIISQRITVTTAATLLSNPVHGSVNAPISCVVRNAGGVSIFLGGAAVAAADGFELAAGESLTLDLLIGDLLYGITAAISSTAHVMKLRQ